ncbi:hypothetical protein [Nocardioides aquiterrae]|uniref:Ig-like domain-containing protein n=1 Tax=Nocardioides aquiterrae TaxID=203799 RepID=A0ABN1UJL0_9ACTN
MSTTPLRRALACLAGLGLATLGLAVPAQASDPLYVYPTAPSPVTVAKTWSAGTVANGGTVTAHVVATNPTGVTRTIIFQDTYDFGLAPASLPGGCGTTSYTGYPMFFCHVTVPAMGTAAVDIPFTATYVGPKQFKHTWRMSEAVDVQKQETYVSLPAGQTQTFSVACPSGYAEVDHSLHVLGVDQGTGTIDDVHVVSSTLTATGWSVTVQNGATGQAQAKLFATCLKTYTNTGGTIAVSGIQSFSVDNFLPVGDVPSEFEATCPADQTPVALNLNGAQANSNYPNVHDVLLTQVGMKADGGRSSTVFAVVNQPTDTTLQWRCLSTKSTTGNRFEFRVETETVTVGAMSDAEVQVYCDHGEKGIVGGWYGGPLNGSEPRPVSRTYWFHNTSAAPVTYTAKLLCVGSRLVRGVKVAAFAKQERCNYLGGVESPAETEYLNHDEECLLVRQS